MSLIDLLKEKVEKQLAAYDEQLEAAQAKSKAKIARAEADVAGAELEQHEGSCQGVECRVKEKA